MGARDWATLLVLSWLWGSSFLFFKVLGHSLPPFTIVLGRLGLAACVLNLVLAARGQGLRRHMPWRDFAVLGVLNSVVPFALFAWGETFITSGMAAMLNATTPLWAVLLAHAVRTERLTWARAAGVALGLAGVAVLVGPAAALGVRAGLPGMIACLFAAALYAVSGQYVRRLHAVPPLQVAAGQLTAGAVIVLPLAAVFERFWLLPAPDAKVWGALGGLAVLGTAFAYMLFYRLVARAGATRAMLVTFLLPVTGLLLGWAVLGESVPGRAWPGMALIGAGLAAIDGGLLRRMRLPT